MEESKRANIKRAVSKYRNYLEDLCEETENVVELKARKEKFAANWDLFNAVLLENDLLENNEKESDKQRMEFEKIYFELISKSQIIIDEWERESKRVEREQLKKARRKKASGFHPSI